MAAGRRGGYRGNELRDRESDMKFMRKRCTSSGEGFDYYRDGDRDRKGSSRREIERSKERNYGEKVTVIREKDIVSRDLGINWSCEREVRVFDRSGDLSEKTSVLESQVENNEGLCIEDDIFSSSRKKRKCSSIVWDEKEKVVSNSSIIDPSETIVSQESSMELDQCCGLQSSLPKSGNLSGSVGSTVTENSSSHSDPLGNNDHEEGQLEEEEFFARNISASRWADTSPSPRDKVRRPEPGELARERLEGIQTKSSQSVEGENYDGSVHQGEYSDHNLVSYDSVDIDEENTAGSVNINNAEMGSEGKSCISNFPKRNINMLLGCRSVHEFERLNKINEGTYGVVYRAKDKRTGEIVALKKVKMEKEREGFPLTSLREINILLSSNHPSIVDVKEVVMDGLDGIFMVMEYMEHDLKGLMDTMKRPFSQSEVKCLMLQLLEGVKCIHDNWVLHRDLKTSNILLNNQGELKICDFGLSRQYGSPLKPYTQLVVTLWYRAPELLLGAKQYSTAIDMWSLGCIMAELLAKEPLFNGKTEFDQLDKIFRILSTPSEKIWSGISKLHGFKANFVRHQYNQLREKFPPKSFTGSPVLSDAGFDLLSRLLTYDPEMRISAEDAVNHEWFHEAPLPKSKDFMPTFPAPHTQDRRRGRVLVSPDPLEEQRRRELRRGKLGTGGLFG